MQRNIKPNSLERSANRGEMTSDLIGQKEKKIVQIGSLSLIKWICWQTDGLLKEVEVLLCPGLPCRKDVKAGVPDSRDELYTQYTDANKGDE